MTTTARGPVAGDPGDESLDPGAIPAPAEPRPAAAAGARRRGRGAALLVALGIFLTRVFGLVRTRVMATYLGTSDAADAFTSATRIPNFLQNLFGEGVLSASFIPVYARLLGEGRREEADRVAGSVFGLLAATVTLLVAVGVLATPLAVDTIADGFTGAKRELTITLVRIVFPGTGLLVLSAWCLGILNSHRRFFLSYAAPIAWNLAIILALIWGGVRGMRETELVVFVAWWTVVGSALQFLVQLPAVLRALGAFQPSVDRASPHVREVVRNFGPAFLSRGAVQIGAYVDLSFASHLGTGAQALLGYGQQIYLLPISLFGMSISAAQLTEMSREVGTDDEVARALRDQLLRSVRTVSYFIVPSAVAFLALGDLVAGVIYQSGKFGRADSLRVWAVLVGSAVGLLASALGRLYSSTFFALRDTRTPFRIALVRIALGIALGWAFAFPLRRALGVPEVWGIAGLTAASGLAGWVELALLRRRLAGRIGHVRVPAELLARVLAAAAVAAGAGWGVKLALGTGRPLLVGVAALGVYGAAYLALTWAFGVPEARGAVARVLGRGRGRPPATGGAR